jgi:hypothetical protein
MRETPPADHRSVDAQVVWSDAHTVVYALAGDFGTGLRTVPADGTGTARRLLTEALAPAYVGGAPRLPMTRRHGGLLVAPSPTSMVRTPSGRGRALRRRAGP